MSKQEKLILYISFGMISLAVLFYYKLPGFTDSDNSLPSNFIGLTIEAKGDTKIRYGNSFKWEAAKKDTKIYTNTYLYTGPDSSGVFGFLDGSTMNLGESSLILLDFELKDVKREFKKSDPISLELVEGRMEIDLKKNARLKKINVASATIGLNEDSTSISLVNSKKNGVNVSTIKGSVSISQNDKTYDVKAGERLIIKKNKIPKIAKVSKNLLNKMKTIEKESQLKPDTNNENDKYFIYFGAAVYLIGLLFIAKKASG